MSALHQAEATETLPEGVTLAFCRLDDDGSIALEAARASLTRAELDRAERFKFDVHAHRYIRGRGFMREKLAERLACSPAEVPLTTGPYGKPELPEGSPAFNFSNSADLGVLAIRQGGAIGIDLELADRNLDPLAIAESCFLDHEIAALRDVADAEAQRVRFLAFWTAKEALMKLTGLGMTLSPKSISLVLDAGSPRGFDAPDCYRSVLLLRPDVGLGRHVSLALG